MIDGARRAAGPLLCLVALAAGACKPDRSGGPLRLGYFPNLTHAQALVGVGDGTFARALDGRFEARLFNAGPAAIEALVAGDLDAAFIGPGPAIVAYLRTREVVVVAGAMSGGALLVARPGIERPGDLVGKRVGCPQIANTQDIALRTWLRQQGLPEGHGPRRVRVTPLHSAEILSLYARGDLAAAWVAEPWASRLLQAGARVLVDERSLWPGGAFPTTVLVASRRALAERRAELVALARAHVELTRRWKAEPGAFREAVNARLAEVAGEALPEEILVQAFGRVSLTVDPLPDALAEVARDAQALGYAPEGAISEMVDHSVLDEATR